MREILYISWDNGLGGYEYFPFSGYKDHAVEIVETGTTTKNIFPGWPKSYGPHAIRITKQTFRKVRRQMVVRTQILTSTQAQVIAEGIKGSIDVCVVNGSTKRDLTGVIVDDNSVVYRRDKDKVHTLTFTITYDDLPTKHA